MNSQAIGIAAIIFYLLAAARITMALLRPQDFSGRCKLTALALGTLALIFHAATLYPVVLARGGINLGVFNAASLVAWIIVVFILITSLRQSVQNLAIVIMPLAALCIALDLVFPSQLIIPVSASPGLQMHILFSVLAYSILAIAALQALVLALEDHLLRKKRILPVLHFLPPLQDMEVLLFRLIGAGFVLLTVSLISGSLYIEDLFAQHLVHKTVLSSVAWLVFALLLWGRWRWGWRGRLAVRYTLTGFILLMLAYFGSKVVLELILHRI